jgi:hypothetical protein
MMLTILIIESANDHSQDMVAAPLLRVSLRFRVHGVDRNRQHAKGAFDETVTRHRDVFGDVQWEGTILNHVLSLTVLAYHLRDLQDAPPEENSGTGRGFTREELVAVGYNTGKDNMLKTANGTQMTPEKTSFGGTRHEPSRPTPIGTAGQDYLNGFHSHWTTADNLICGSGNYRCH